MAIPFAPAPDWSLSMPVLNDKDIQAVPLEMLEPYREKAQLYYGRSLERIAEHRGMTAVEIMQLIRPEGWEPKDGLCSAVLEQEVRLWKTTGQTKLSLLAEPLVRAAAVSQRVSELYNRASEELKHDYSDCQPAEFKGAIAHLTYLRSIKSEESLDSMQARPFVLYMTIDGRAWSFEGGVKVERTQEIEPAPRLDPRNFITPATRKMVDHYEAIIADLSTKITTLFYAIKHGDEDHQGWLKEAIECHFNGDPMPEYVAGKSKTEKAITDFFNNIDSQQAEPGQDIGIVEFVKRPIELKLLGWRLDYPIEIPIEGRWVGADDWKRKDRLVLAGARATELWGDPAKAPSSGPSPWPVMAQEYQHRPDEPFFVLLGRDPQAPDLIEDWAQLREVAEPGDWKIAEARQTAQDMRMYKLGNPGVGMSSEAYEAANAALAPVTVEEMPAGMSKVLAKIAEENPEALPLALQLTDNKPCPTCNYHWAHCRCPKTETERIGDVINAMPVGMGLALPLGFEDSEAAREYRSWQDQHDPNESYAPRLASSPYNPAGPAPSMVHGYNPAPPSNPSYNS